MNKEEEVKEFQAFIVAEAKSKNKDPEQYAKELGEEGLKEAYKRYQAYKKKQTQKAKHGAKLQYIKFLTNKCEDDEELIYFKKGGILDCGCVKKELGGPVKKDKKENPVSKFKRTKEEQKKIDKLSEEDYFKGTADHTKPGTPVQKKVKKNCGGSALISKFKAKCGAKMKKKINKYDF